MGVRHINALWVILLLVLINGILAGAEIAIVAVRKTRVQQLVNENRRGARSVLFLRMHPERFLATVQVGITVIGATASAIGGQSLVAKITSELSSVDGLASWATELAFIVVVGGISFLSIVLGELVPKSLALRQGEKYALMIARPLTTLASLARPVVWVLTASSNLVLKLFGDRTSFTEVRVSTEELQQLLDEASASGSLDPRVSDIASRAIQFGELIAADVMVPRNQMVMLDRSAASTDVYSRLRQSVHSRFPVFADGFDNVVGYVAAKDVLSQTCTSTSNWIEFIRPVPFVPDTMRAVDVLQDLQHRRMHLAVVVDEHGGIVGMLTTEDLIEELVGELFGEEERPTPAAYQRMQDGSVVVAGTMPVRDANRELALDLPEGELWTTIAGLFLAKAGHLPAAGEKVRLPAGLELEAHDVSARQIRRIRLRGPSVLRDASAAQRTSASDAEQASPPPGEPHSSAG